MNFIKMHGLGNDFVILDQREGVSALAPERIRHICDRHRGVGCDQLIVMEPSEKADLFMRIYNSNGSEAQSCGNATRCVADICMKDKGSNECTIETLAGVLPCRRAGDGLIEADMGAPGLDWGDVPLSHEMDTLNLGIGQGNVFNPVAVGMGNPHCVFFVDDLGDIAVEKLGRKFETDPLYPENTNVEFAQVMQDGKIRLRVWERGAGLTLACGSGACATVVAAIRRGLLPGRKAEIEMDGGTLQMEWRESDNHVLMTGPVAYVFEGTLNE